MRVPHRSALAVACAAAAACAGVRPLAAPQPEPTGAARERAELAACRDGTLPPWLDDRALADAEARDRYDAGAFEPSESYAQGTSSSHQPSLPSRRASDARAERSATVRLMAERQALQQRCAELKAGGSLPPGKAAR